MGVYQTSLLQHRTDSDVTTDWPRCYHSKRGVVDGEVPCAVI